MLTSENFMKSSATNPYSVSVRETPLSDTQHSWKRSSDKGLPQEIVGMRVLVTPVDWKTKKPVNTEQVTTYCGRSEERNLCHNSESFYSDELCLGFIDKRQGTQRSMMYGVFSRIEWDESAAAFYCASYITPWQRFEIKPLPQRISDGCRRSLLWLCRLLDIELSSQ